jgi:PAS domain S-box-containing protein
MKTDRGDQAELLAELEALRRRVGELEAIAAVHARIEGQLRDSEERYRVLYDENPSMYFTVDPEGTVLSVNPFGARQLGYAVDELVRRPVLEVFHPDDREAVTEQLRGCVRRPGEAFGWEFRKIRKDGAVMWVRELARSVRDSHGRTVVLIVCEDITSRRQIEEDLRHSRERYRRLYTKTPVMLHSIDRDHRLLDVSDHWLAVLGYEREEVIGRKSPEFLTEQSRRFAEEKVLPEFVRTGECRAIPYQFVKKNGEIIDIELSAIAERNPDGTFLHSLAVLIDVTDRNRAEEALRRARDEMERQVERRTAELEQQRAFLRQVLDINPNLIFAKDRQGRFTLVNQAVADAYGTTVEDLTGRTDADFNPNPEEVAYFRRIDLEVMNSRTERVIPEEMLTDAHGKVRWLQTVKRPILGEDGACDQVLGTATDVTARKAAEEKLRASEAALRQSQRELQELAGRLLTAQEDERARLAREMHDDLTQRLAALTMRAARLEGMLAGSAPEARRAVSEMRDDLARLSADVQALSRQLHPAILEDLGLVDAVQAECDAFSQRTGIAVTFRARGVPRGLSRDQSLGLYRITQEALRNVEKHAATTRARVSLLAVDAILTLSIEDAGQGFNTSRAHGPRGLGLGSMEERARLMGAEFSLDSRPGKGTQIEVRLPL